MLPEFDFYVPKSLPDALRFLAEGQSDVVPVAGGTNVVVDLRSKRHTPKFVMNIDCLPELKGIRRENGHVVVGGCTTIAELLRSAQARETALPLVQAAGLFANPLVRNRATVGGNLADASPAADTAPALLAVDAEVELTSQRGSRWMRLEEFFVGVRKTRLQPDELLTSVRWAVPTSPTASGYYKLGLRKADAISVVSAAVVLEGDGNGGCKQARIALGSVAPRPIRAHQAEDALRGRPLTPETVTEAARLAAEDASPISDIRGSASYRKRMVEVFTRRLLLKAVDDLMKAE